MHGKQNKLICHLLHLCLHVCLHMCSKGYSLLPKYVLKHHHILYMCLHMCSKGYSLLPKHVLKWLQRRDQPSMRRTFFFSFFC